MKDILQGILIAILFVFIFGTAIIAVQTEQKVKELETQVQIYTELMDMYFKG